MAKIVWIASYPKSGNTWLRFLLANVLHQKPIESSAEVRELIPDIHEGILGRHLWGPRSTLIKTHWAFHTRFPLREDTVGIIHLVRHPVATLESNQNYAINRSGNLTRQASAAQVASLAQKFVEGFIQNGGHKQFIPNGIGTLEEHVASWSSPILRYQRIQIRYEDLVADTAGTLRKLVDFLGIARSDAEVAMAVDSASMEAMRRIEEAEIAGRREGIFFQTRNEAAIDAGLRFVGRSADGKTRYALTPEQKDAARRRFAGLIRQLGYPE
jgi:hypothetical protein